MDEHKVGDVAYVRFRDPDTGADVRIRMQVGEARNDGYLRMLEDKSEKFPPAR